MIVTVRDNTPINIRDILQRSPVRDIPGAEAVMQECMFRSQEIRYGFVDGTVACVWGLIPPTIMSDSAYLWLLTTDIVAEHKFLFIRHSQVQIEDALELYPTIIGDCEVGNAQAFRWLRWLGAEFAEPIGKRVPFVIRKKLNG